MDSSHQKKGPSILWNSLRFLLILLLLIVGLTLGIGGIKLLLLKGSGYYLMAGIAYLLCAAMLFFRLRFTAYFSILIFIATAIWAWNDAPELSYWTLLPRLVVPAILMLLTLWNGAYLPKVGTAWRRGQLGITGLGVIALVATFIAAFYPHGEYRNSDPQIGNYSLLPDQSKNWDHFGRDANGTRFAPDGQITPENINQLQVAWTYHTGRRTTGSGTGVDENTPIQIGNTLYSCTPENIVTAINGDTGQAKWRFDPHARTAEHVTCRGVAYYDIDKDQSLSAQQRADYKAQQCRRRILVSTVDGRLIALDADNGKMCQNFGNKGTVDLLAGMGPTENSKRYHPSSVPVLMGHLAILGAWVRDLQEDEPSGAVRAFDAITGKLAWAWDVGRPFNNNATANNAADGSTVQQFTKDTPNVWSVPTYDQELNMVYVPTGNGPPDYWGGERSAANEKYGSAVVALDASTGKVRWTFQTVHHDVWDFDVPSQPTLTDIKDSQGRNVRALIQTTKTGNIFILDRLTGQPVTTVEEKEVPTSPHAQGDSLSPTQPYSTEMPRIGAAKLNENSMWGISPFDQLYCRIKFKDSNYQGDFTPPTEQPYIEFPGLLGGMNWGGVSIDPTRHLLFVNDMRMALRMRLVTKEEAKNAKVSTDEVPGFMGTIRPQIAGPYGGVGIDILQSPLGVPCLTPPFGTLSAINLDTKKLVWQIPMGSVKDTGPLGITTHMNVPLGMPTLGGPTSTASGIVFFAGTQDFYLRAMDSNTGKIIWSARLPAGSTAAPLVYTSPETGRQYVVISAGGTSHSPVVGDSIIAYALPEKK